MIRVSHDVSADVRYARAAVARSESIGYTGSRRSLARLAAGLQQAEGVHVFRGSTDAGTLVLWIEPISPEGSLVERRTAAGLSLEPIP